MTKDMNVIIDSCILFATADWDEPYWTNKQHCASSLADLGVKVLYIESVGLRSPQGKSLRDWQRLKQRLFSGLRSLFLGAIERKPGIYVISPLVVPAGYRFLLTRTINKFLLLKTIKQASKKLGLNNSIIWTYHPFMLDVPKEISHRGILYHCVDDVASVPGVDNASYKSEEKKLLATADIVFTTAPALADYCEIYNKETHYLPNVVDADHFGGIASQHSTPKDISAIPEPRIIYHGVLSDFKINFELLLSAIKLRPQWNWIFIGEEREGQKSKYITEMRNYKNTHLLGYRKYEDIPKYLAASQVGILPSLINDYTYSMFPMKYFEYIASGIPVASTPLNALQNSQVEVAFGNNAEEFCQAIEKQLQRGKLDNAETTRIIGHNTWRARTKKMLSEFIRCTSNKKGS
ncbi:MAG: glycosyl transferase family 1 [Pseudomonas sp. PGPPP4]|uniref:glycosyltransferase n=1 Tax=Pseudomonas sp. PGPPP4 TaxID=2015556 RepID=UPI000BD78F51|nr:glycosyltransferase [Pseudomonas sp. PGPPP4]OYT84562.1 MAG: glycosyl transferase family 1 [Pseudomonas sp. PGPPP4]